MLFCALLSASILQASAFSSDSAATIAGDASSTGVLQTSVMVVLHEADNVPVALSSCSQAVVVSASQMGFTAICALGLVVPPRSLSSLAFSLASVVLRLA